MQNVKLSLLAVTALLISITSSTGAREPETARPNILWIYAEDLNPWYGCYGHDVNKGHTPNVDRLAENGVMFSRAYVPNPVCSATRSAIIMGLPVIRFNAHHHRSSMKGHEINLPEGMKPLPQILAETGYETFNFGKTDYNFTYDRKRTFTTKLDKNARSKEGYTKAFSTLLGQQPFFGQIQTRGGKRQSKEYPEGFSTKTNPDEVTVPADYPQDQKHRELVAQHYDTVRLEDMEIGIILHALKEAGLEKNTIVVCFSDHGAPHLLRHKQRCTEGGLHVPFVINGPAQFIKQRGVKRNELVNMLDLSATTLGWAGVTIPDYYEGQDLFSPEYVAPTWVAASADRQGQTIDRVRSLRTERFRYVRNYMLDRTFLQPHYRQVYPYYRYLHQLYYDDKLSPRHKEIYFGERQPEEFYDVVKDPAMMHDLAKDPAYADELDRHRKLLGQWLAKGDTGEQPEDPIEIKKYLKVSKIKKSGVNPKFETLREDSDGDGLSDVYELVNGTDPEDGLLVFNFDCGGNQLEGWKSKGIDNNIAGFLGYLDFYLNDGAGSLIRNGLKIQARSEDKILALVYKVSKPVKASLLVNDQLLSAVDLSPSEKFQTARFTLNKDVWKNTIQSVEIKLQGADKSFLEIDSISVQR